MVASRLLTHGLLHLNVRNVSRLCKILNCTPNDLFDWKPEPAEPLSQNHPLQSLVRQESANISDLLKDIPLEKLPDLHAMIDELRRK